MPYRLYAMDTYFYNSITRYPFEVRCEMLADLGYDASYLTCWSEQSWKDVAKLATVKASYGLDVAAVYGVADFTTLDPRLIKLLETLEGCDTIELAIKASDSGGEETVLRELDRMLAIAERRNLRILLYPHINFWMERIEAAARLCKRIQHPKLGLTFCGFHWYAVDGQEVGARLRDAGEHLKQVNLCGSRRDPNAVGGKATIEPLDEGEMDNFAILGQLRRLGFTGLIGFQGYGSGGDPYAKLRRSLLALRDMETRLDHHPNWTQIQL